MFVVFLAVALMAGAGLVIDGGYALAARRAGDEPRRTVRTRRRRPAQRARPPRRHRASRPGSRHAPRPWTTSTPPAPTGRFIIHGDRVTVTVTGTYRPALLTVVGVDEIPIGATATATSVDQP